MKENAVSFGGRIKIAMLRAGIGVADKPAAVLWHLWMKKYPERPITRSAVHLWLNSEHANMSVEYLFRLGKLLNMSVRWLALHQGSMTPAIEMTMNEIAIIQAYRAVPPQVKEKIEKDTAFLLATFGERSVANPTKPAKT